MKQKKKQIDAGLLETIFWRTCDEFKQFKYYYQFRQYVVYNKIELIL